MLPLILLRHRKYAQWLHRKLICQGLICLPLEAIEIREDRTRNVVKLAQTIEKTDDLFYLGM